MRFETVRRGEWVRYRVTSDAHAGELSVSDTRWQGEPLGCVMQVDSIALDGEIFLSCTRDCGQHLIESISQEEYQEWSNILQASVLRVSSVSEALTLPEQPPLPAKKPAGYLRYDEDYEVQNILNFLAREVGW